MVSLFIESLLLIISWRVARAQEVMRGGGVLGTFMLVQEDIFGGIIVESQAALPKKCKPSVMS